MESFAEIFVGSVVSGSATFEPFQKLIAPSCSFGLRWLAKVCSAVDGGRERLPRHAVARVEHEHGAERLLRGVARRYECGTQDGATVLGHVDVADRQALAARQLQHVRLDRVGRALRLDQGRVLRRAGSRRRRGEDAGDEDRSDERESFHRPAVPAAAAAPNSASGAWKSPSGSATPRFSNFVRNFGRRPVARRPPTTVPSLVTSSIWNLNSS